jgi:hypothetical protein
VGRQAGPGLGPGPFVPEGSGRLERLGQQVGREVRGQRPEDRYPSILIFDTAEGLEHIGNRRPAPVWGKVRNNC